MYVCVTRSCIYYCNCDWLVEYKSLCISASFFSLRDIENNASQFFYCYEKETIGETFVTIKISHKLHPDEMALLVSNLGISSEIGYLSVILWVPAQISNLGMGKRSLLKIYLPKDENSSHIFSPFNTNI